MSLAAGTRLAHYEIVEPIGEGGMAEVYRASDTKLGRDVAIKVLPEELASEKERLDRFEREARLLAQLNHANVATLHGLEEHEGRRFLVMELVEGDTLAERIAKGPISVEDAILLFIQIADGLNAAHEKGVIHRDLKPANIKITPEGQIKILDFGLAKAFTTDENASAETSQSPTLTKGTALGAIMGTASYMSPEQARGKTVDRRTDIWAFGCCLYEVLAGITVAAGPSASTSPFWSPDGETLYVRSDQSEGVWRVFAVSADGGGPMRQIADIATRDISSISSNGSVLLFTEPGRDIATLALDEDGRASTILGSSFDEHSGMLSPDDLWLAYVSNESGREEVYVRSFPDLDQVEIVSAGGGDEPLWSKDGTELFYRRGDWMMAVSVAVSDDGRFRAGAPNELFEGSFRHAGNGRPAHYDVHPDGTRFVMVEEQGSENLPREIHIVLNWFQELEGLAPTEPRAR